MRFGFASGEIHPEELPGEEAYIKNSIGSRRGSRNMDGSVISCYGHFGVAIEVVRYVGRAREMHPTTRTGRLRDQTLMPCRVIVGVCKIYKAHWKANLV